MFYQKVNKRSREAMTGFLVRHYRYNTMNSWNRSTSYANNVKVPNLDIPQELQDLAYDVAGGEVEAPDWDMFFARTVTDFYRRTGYHIGFNGRSSGYLVLYEAKANGDGTYSIYSVILQLRYLQKTEPKAPVTIYINSPGGEVSSGLALYDVMQAVRCPVHTVCVGTAASMAAILLACGDRRGILPHGRVMVHDPLTTGISGSALTIDSLSKSLMQTRQITAEILARHTGRTLEEIYACTAKDTYFNAQEAIDFGLADYIVKEI